MNQVWKYLGPIQPHLPVEDVVLVHKDHSSQEHQVALGMSQVSDENHINP